MKGNSFRSALILTFTVVFVVAFNGGSAASPYVTDLSVTAHSGGLKCNYIIEETPVTGDQLTSATAWYRQGSPIMIVYLPFEGGSVKSILDYSGNDQTVEIYGEWSDPEWIPDGGHDGGGAYYFDGNDAFDAGDIFPTRSSYTKTAWIYREILYPEYLWHNIISGHSHDANNHCFKVNPDGCLGAGHNAGEVMVSDPDPILEKTWYFVAVTFDYDTGAMRLYKNGQQVNAATLPEEYWEVTDPGVYIGRMETFWMWQGKLDDCRIYNYALSAEQIRLMYEQGNNVIASPEVADGEQWYAAVTPFNTTQAGTTQISNTLTINDDDSDGVLNAYDLCPDTPEGEDVNEDGCALSQLDSDGDGVSDDIDLCPDTPEGSIVDADGCASSQIDSDGDGVADDMDLCPNTPEGEKVDKDGCAPSQLDSDGDGVSDDIDLCPDTPEGSIVDADGCASSQIDSDSDGVADDMDLCPNTPEGEKVDKDGCAPSQLDSDGDGISDDIDLCPDTPEGDEVDEDGCSFLQRDSDSDSIPDYLEQGSDPENPDPGYDGNSDGQPDYLQSNVVSFFANGSEKYLTLAVTDPAGASLSDIGTPESPAVSPEDTEFPYGNIAFTISGVGVGGKATVELHLPQGETCDTYYKYGRTIQNQSQHWYEFMYDDDTETGARIDDNVITLFFVDGGRGDDDLMEDGVIMDDSAPANNTGPAVGEESGGGGGGGCFFTAGSFSSYPTVPLSISLLLGLALISLARSEGKRRKK